MTPRRYFTAIIASPRYSAPGYQDSVEAKQEEKLNNFLKKVKNKIIRKKKD